MKLLRARERENDIYFKVWLDTSKLAVGQPDPLWVREYTFSTWARAQSTTVRQGQTKAQYIQDIKSIVRREAQAELSRMTAPPPVTEIPLAAEGEEF